MSSSSSSDLLFPPLPIAGKHSSKRYRMYKQFYQEHHAPSGRVSHDDYLGNGVFWLFILLLLAGVLVLFSISIWRPLPPPPPPPYVVAKRNVRRSAGGAHKRTACTTGEFYDSDVGMCAPNFHSPLAFDGALMDSNVQPCSSFYRMMCGKWNDEHTNDNRAFAYGYYKNQRRLTKLIQRETVFQNGILAPLPSSSSVTDFYRSCLRATKRSQKESILEHQHMMKKILGSANALSDMPAVFGKLGRAGYTSPFVVSIERHPTEPRMLPLLAYEGFPADLTENEIIRIYQRSHEVHKLNILEQENHISSVVNIMRACRLHKRRAPEDIVDYENYLRSGDFQRDVMRFDVLPQEWNVKGHARMRGAWDVFFQELDGSGMRFHHDQEVWVLDREYFDWLLNFGLAQFTFRDWYAFVEFSILYNGHQFVPDLPDNVYFKQHERRGPLGPKGRFYNRLRRKRNVPVIGTNPEEDCTRIVQHLLPGLVSKEFLEGYFPEKEAIKKDVRSLTEGILQSFVSLIERTPWMSPEDKAVLQHKMRSTVVRVAEPNQWEAEPFAERISEDLYHHNLNMIRAYRVQRNLALWSRDNVTAFDRSAIAFFAIPLTDVNAYYSPTTNTITVLAGILQHPFYARSYNAVSKYAILGSILGHELSHMADNHGLYWGAQGSYHADGILSQQGMQMFFQKSQCVAREYGPAPMGCENADYGNSTLGEDLADLTGITLAWETLLGDASIPSPLGDRQHFFMILAQSFCETYDQEHLCEAVAHDEHAIAMFRINRTFRNMKGFQEAFSCSAGSSMFKEQGGMCKVYG